MEVSKVNAEKLWSEEDIDNLRSVYPELLNREVAIKFGRSIKAINAQAHLLGLRKTANFISRIQQAKNLGKNKINIDTDILKRLYINNQYSLNEIARQLGVSMDVIRNRLQAENILIRNRNQASQIGAKFKAGKEDLIKLYLNDKLNGRQIAQMYDVDKAVIYRHLRKFGIIPRKYTSNLYFQNREHRQEHGLKSKKNWQNPDYILKQLKARSTRPNKVERKLDAIIQEYFPQFKYNGDGSLGVVLAHLVPDWVNVNGKKQVIELFGDYWHKKSDLGWNKSELGRIMAYNSIGYDTVIIWEHELNNTNAVISKIRDFAIRDGGKNK
jgi:predicted DNA-binding protein YlxM (UPF0122 family)